MKFTPASAKKTWYLSQYGKSMGPFDYSELRAKCKSPNVDSDTLAWKEGMAEWEPIHKIEELSPLLDILRPGSSTQSNLHLTRRRAFESLSKSDAETQAGVEVHELLAGQQFVSGKAKQNEKPKISKSISQRFLPGSIEFAVFWICVLLAGIGCLAYFDYWHGIVIAASCILILFSGILILVRAFQLSAWWGIGCILFFPVMLVYYFVDWDKTWRCLFISSLAWCAIFLTLQDPKMHKSPIYKDLKAFKTGFMHRNSD